MKKTIFKKNMAQYFTGILLVSSLFGICTNVYCQEDDGAAPKLVGPNLVKNGSFEKGTKGWEGDTKKLFGAIKYEKAPHGKKVFLFKKKGKARGWCSIKNKISLEPGAMYMASVQVFAPLGKAFGVGLSIHENGNLLYSRGLKKDANALKEWQYVEAFFQVPDTVVDPVLSIGMGGKNSQYELMIDDVRLFKVGNPDSIKNADRIRGFTGDIKMVLKDGMYPSPMEYSGDNGGPSQNFNNHSKYFSDIMYSGRRSFGGFMMGRITEDITAKFPVADGDKKTLAQNIKIIKENPNNNPIITPAIIEKYMADEISRHPTFIRYNQATIETNRLDANLVKCTGPWSAGTKESMLWSDFVKNWANTYIMAKNWGVIDYNPANEPDHKSFKENYEDYAYRVSFTADAQRHAAKLATGKMGRVWGPTFAGHNKEALDLIAKKADHWIDVWDWHQYNGDTGSYINRSKDYTKRINEINTDGHKEPMAITEFNYVLGPKRTDTYHEYDDMNKILRQPIIMKTQIENNIWAAMRFSFTQLFKNSVSTTDMLEPHKYYYLIRSFNRAAIRPRYVVPFDISGDSLTQYGFVTRGPYSYFVVLINHIETGNTDLTVDLGVTGLTEGKAWVRQVSDSVNDRIVDTVAYSNGKLVVKQVPPMSMSVICIPRGEDVTKQEKPYVHRAFNNQGKIELWWKGNASVYRYSLLRKVGSGEWSVIDDNVQDHFYTDTNAPSGDLYYKLIPWIGDAKGPESDVIGPLQARQEKALFPHKVNFHGAKEMGKDWETVSGEWSIGSIFMKNSSTTIPGQQPSITVTGDTENWIDYNVRTVFKIKKAGDNAEAGMVFRYLDNKNYYLLRLQNSSKSILLSKFKDGKETVLSRVPMKGSSGKFKLEKSSYHARYDLNVSVNQGAISVYVKPFVRFGHNYATSFEFVDKDPIPSGKVGYYAAGDVQPFFDGLFVNANFIEPFNKGLDRWQKLSGDWELKGEQLTQTDLSPGWKLITGGNPTWKDTYFTARVRLEKGKGAAAVFFRFIDPDNNLRLEIGTDKSVRLVKRVDGKETELSRATYPIKNGEYYTLGATLDRNYAIYSINGWHLGDAFIYEPKLPAGKTALGTRGGSASFDDVEFNK